MLMKLKASWLLGRPKVQFSIKDDSSLNRSYMYPPSHPGFLLSSYRLDVCCAFQVLTEVSKREIAVLRTFQTLAAGIFTRPAEISAAHARHIHLCNNCLSTITGHQSFDPKDFADADLNFKQEKDRSYSGFLSLGKTPSLVQGLRDFADLDLEDKQVTHPEGVEESILSRDSLSDTSSEASFADVSSVESGRRGRSGHVNARSDSNMSKTYKKTRRTDVREAESSSESEGETEKPQKSQIKKSKETDGSTRARGGTAVRFNVQEPEVSTTEGGAPTARMERSFTKDSVYSVPTQGSSVTLPLADEGEVTIDDFLYLIAQSFRLSGIRRGVYL